MQGMRGTAQIPAVTHRMERCKGEQGVLGSDYPSAHHHQGHTTKCHDPVRDLDGSGSPPAVAGLSVLAGARRSPCT